MATSLAPRTSSSSSAPALESAAFYSILLLLVFGPLAFGAVEEWSSFALKVGAVVAAMFWAAAQAVRREVRIRPSGVYVPMLLLAAMVGIQLMLGISAHPYATRSAALLYGMYAILGFVSVQLIRGEERVRKFCIVLAIFGFAVALFGIIQNLSSHGTLYWMITPRQGGSVYGPYVNRSHFAGLMELLMPFALVPIFRSQTATDKRFLLGFAALVMVTATVLSQSRGGTLSILMEIVFLAICLGITRDGKRAVIILALLLIAATVSVAGLGAGEIVARFNSLGEQEEGGPVTRIRIARDCLALIAQHPLLGTGLGTFADVYPRVRSYATDLSVGQAHNDYLQCAVEMGLAGLAVTMWLIVLLYRRGLSRLSEWHRNWQGCLRIAGMTACTGLLVHSFMDFNLQIPANALLFFILMGLVCSDSGVSTKRVKRSRHRHAYPKPEGSPGTSMPEPG
jgi:O-antigen ligase